MVSIIANSLLEGKEQFAAGVAQKAREEAEEAAAEAGDEIKIIDEEVEELVEGDIKLKEDEAAPKEVPIKKKTKKIK